MVTGIVGHSRMGEKLIRGQTLCDTLERKKEKRQTNLFFFLVNKISMMHWIFPNSGNFRGKIKMTFGQPET
jgi:hypothetical protein